MKRVALVVATALLGLAPAVLLADVPSANDARPHAPLTPQERQLRRPRHGQGPFAGEPSAPASGSGSAAPPAPSSSATPPDGPRAAALKQLADLAATRLERRAHHHAELLREVGAHLREPAVKEELALHANRVADLARIELLAQSARTGADRQKLLTRATAALARESARHERRMKKLLAAAPPAATGADSATPAPPPSAEAPR